MRAEQILTKWERKGNLTPKQTILLVEFLGIEEIGIFLGVSGNKKKRLRVKLWGERRLTAIPVDQILGLTIFSVKAIEELLEDVRGIAEESNNITSHEKTLDLVSRVKCLVSQHFPMTEMLD